MPAEWTMRPGGETGTVLILGNYRPALTVARKLKALGYRVAVNANKQQPLLEYSRAVSLIWDAPPPSDQGFMAALLSFIDAQGDVVAIIPVSEPMVDVLAANWKALASREVRLATPAPAIVRRCHDKTGMLDLATRAGLDCPPYAVASNADVLDATAIQVGFPLVIRPLTPGSRFGTLKAITVASREELACYPAELFEAAGPMLLQRHFSGRRYNVYFAARNGRIVDEQHVCILRSDRVDGSGLAVEGTSIADIPELSRDVHRLVHMLDYTGIGCAQFLFDETTRARCFLEINPRLGANYALVEAAGMPLTRLCLALAEAQPEHPVPLQREQRSVHFAWTYGDLAGLWHAVTQGDVGLKGALAWLGDAIRAGLTADMHITWTRDDPKPTLMTYMGRLMPRLRPWLAQIGRRFDRAGRPQRCANGQADFHP
ncbi:hypothetical protein [Rhodoligotrophos defluvii]|uniref:ATP-binding protein n=1 Tax=Rhodoligotrophos defluvii TaxID=2561934 RepID=UPI00195FA693|nr:hypothetical protein [Rhodoligotrophos defluvii]